MQKSEAYAVYQSEAWPKSSVMVHACNPSIQEVEAGGSGAPGQFWIQETLPQKAEQNKTNLALNRKKLLSMHKRLLTQH